MFEFLKEKGDALKNLFNKDDEKEDERSSVKKLTDFQEAKEAADIALTEEDKKIQSIEDTEQTESIKEILDRESAKKEKEGKEKDLEDKLADIEKVISTFGERTDLSSKTSDPLKEQNFL